MKTGTTVVGNDQLRDDFIIENGSLSTTKWHQTRPERSLTEGTSQVLGLGLFVLSSIYCPRKQFQ